MAGGTSYEPSALRMMSVSVQSESTANEPSGVGRTDARGVLSTALRASGVGVVVTSRASGVASGMATPNSATMAGTADPVASRTVSARNSAPAEVRTPRTAPPSVSTVAGPALVTSRPPQSMKSLARCPTRRGRSTQPSPGCQMAPAAGMAAAFTPGVTSATSAALTSRVA